MSYFRMLIFCALFFISGFLAPHPWEVNGRIYTNVDDGTLLNHGQKSIQIRLPYGKRFNSFGGCGPHWKTDDGKSKDMYWDSFEIQIEKIDQDLIKKFPQG